MKTIKNLVLLTVGIWLLSASALGQNLPSSPEGTLEFAEFLRNTNEHYRAITEYKRFLYHWPEHPNALECRYRIGLTYLQGKSFTSAIDSFSSLTQETMSSDLSFKTYNALACALYLNKDYRGAISVLSLWQPQTPKTDYAETWCHLQQHDVTSAIALWESKNPNTSPYDTITFHLQSFQNLPQKSPGIAGLMSSILPGSGQVYCGRWRDGLISFLLNGLLIGAVTAAIHEEHYEAAALVGFFEIGFYSANVYNAVNNAHKFNRNIWDSHLNKFENLYGPPFEEILSQEP